MRDPLKIDPYIERGEVWVQWSCTFESGNDPLDVFVEMLKEMAEDEDEEL